MVLHARERAHHRAQACAVDVVHIRQVEKNFHPPLTEQVAHQIANRGALFSQYNPPANIDNGNSLDQSTDCLHLQPPETYISLKNTPFLPPQGLPLALVYLI